MPCARLGRPSPAFRARRLHRSFVAVHESAIGAQLGAERDFSSAGGAPLPARFPSATSASARTLGIAAPRRLARETDSVAGAAGFELPHSASLGAV